MQPVVHHVPRRRLAFFLPSLAGGGAERVSLNLATEAAARGLTVDLVLCKAEGEYLSELPTSVRIVNLDAPRVLSALPGLVRYLRRERPAVLISAMTHANIVALIAHRISRQPTRILVAEHDTLSEVTKRTAQWKVRVMPLLVRTLYPSADAIVAVSAAVADDMARLTGLRRDQVSVVYNPVISPDLGTAAAEHLDHPWFEDGEPPVIIAVGRLTRKKDFQNLVSAFALVRRRRPARLMILGDGPDRLALEDLVHELGLQRDVALLGFVENPHAYLARSALFVLSSLWEGLPTVLIEAMYCGVPVVSTDCPSGPREILDNGRYGKLVPVADSEALGGAILEGLSGLVPAAPRQSCRRFEVATATSQYLALAFGEGISE